MSRPGNDVRRVFDITDVGAVVYRLNIFYVDGCIFLGEVPSPADSVLKWWVIPKVHFPLGVVEKLQLEHGNTGVSIRGRAGLLRKVL